jgi:hypothetical protein
MRSGKQGCSATHRLLGLLFGGLIAVVALPSREAGAQLQIHRNGFEGRQIYWLRGEDNVRAEEKEHKLSSDYAHLGSSSEFIQLVCPEGKNDPNYATYYYPTQPAPITDDLIASLHIKANRAGVQLQARVVLPKERNPQQIDEPMTLIVSGDKYKLTRRWQKMELSNPVKLLKDQQQRLRAQLRRDVDLTDAYIDRLILNLYAGPGQIDVYIDDLEIGPVKPNVPPPPKIVPKKDGVPTAQPKVAMPIHGERGLQVRMERDKLFVDGKPFFFRAIRYSDTPLKTLRDAGFNTVWFDPSVPADKIEEAAAHGFWIVPSLPLLGDTQPAAKGATLTSRGADISTARDVEGLAAAITRFLSGDAVLFWDLGGALQGEKAEMLEQTAKAVALADPQRPRGADCWDSFSTLSHYIEMVGTHRYPLFTSLELIKYRDWLLQRRRLTAGNALHWTWIQTHIPDWQTQVIYGKGTNTNFGEPIGPQAEQIRLLTYLGLAAGCRGLAFSSDRFLADSHQGRDRLLMMALLNQEIHMLEPMLLTLRDSPYWIDTSHGAVKAAVLRSDRGLLVLPIWLGDGVQYVPPQGAITNLSITVPLVPDGMQPWEITPARVQSLQFNAERKLTGMKITIPEFDLTSAIVFTSDLSPKGDVAKWQAHSRLMAPQAAEWAHSLATIQLEKVRKTHAQLEELAPPVLNANELLHQAAQRLEASQRLAESKDYTGAYFEAVRVLRPLRILMRAHWEQAARTLDLPTASPFTVCFYTLPRHWELHHQLRGSRLGANAVSDGDFEAASKLPDYIPMPKSAALPDSNIVAKPDPKSPSKPDPKAPPKPDPKAPPKPDPKSPPKPDLKKNRTAGIAVTELPGWTVQQQTLDTVDMEARIIPSEIARVTPTPKPPRKKDRYDPSTGYVEPPEPPQPELGNCVLRLDVQPKVILTQKDTKALPAPAALERTYLSVNTPAVRLQPGTWVRVSGWVRIPYALQASADGVLLFDNVCGEGMGVRLTDAMGWKKFHLYRKVPPSGVMWITVAMTAIGTVYVDDLRIEPLVKGE